MEHKIKVNALASEALPRSEAVGEAKGERLAFPGRRRYRTKQRKKELLMELLTKSTPTTEIYRGDRHRLEVKAEYFQ
jgi:hypothetical protein